MSNITVAEILKIHGKWIRSKEFVSLVREKLKISEKMAYIKIKKACNNKEILKITLPDRTVLYGLPEFGYPKEKTEGALNFETIFLVECFRELEEISRKASENPALGLNQLRAFISKLPEPLKSELKAKEDSIVEVIVKTQKQIETLPDSKNKLYAVYFEGFRKLLEETSALLHTQKLRQKR